MTWFKTDIPFARDDANKLLPSIVAVMVAITALLMAVGISFAQSLSSQASDAKGAVQVQLSVPKVARDKAIADTVSVLRASTGVSDIVVLKDSEIAALLKPWLGDNDGLSELSLPVLIDVKTVPVNGAPFDVDSLSRSLSAKVKGTQVRASEHWLNQLDSALSIAQTILLLLALSLLVSLVGLAILVSRTSLRLHFKTVNILHLFGATDDYILRQFQYHSGMLVGRGALIGSAVAAMLVWLVHIVSARAQSPILPDISISWLHGVLFLLLPILVAFISLIATRFTVQAMLHRMH